MSLDHRPLAQAQENNANVGTTAIAGRRRRRHPVANRAASTKTATKAVSRPTEIGPTEIPSMKMETTRSCARRTFSQRSWATLTTKLGHDDRGNRGVCHDQQANQGAPQEEQREERDSTGQAGSCLGLAVGHRPSVPRTGYSVLVTSSDLGRATPAMMPT